MTYLTNSLSHNLNAIFTFIRRDLKLWTYFRLNFLVDMAGVFSNLVIFAMVARFGPGTGLEAFNNDYVSFVILGVIFNALMAAAISGPYNGLMDGFWNNRLEVLLMSPISIPAFAAGASLGEHVRSLIRVLVYLLTGIFLFGFTLSAGAQYGLALVYLALAVLACTGLGLLAASMIYYIDARGGQDPIRLVVEILAGLAAGVYFPFHLLPHWARWLAMLIPHSFALDGARQALLGGGQTVATLPLHTLLPYNPHMINITALVLYCLVILPLGWRMFLGGIKLARTDGRLSRWV